MSNTPRIVVPKKQLNNELRRLQKVNQDLTQDLQEANARYVALEGDYYELKKSLLQNNLFLALFSAFKFRSRYNTRRGKIVKQG